MKLVNEIIESLKLQMYEQYQTR